MKNRLLLLAVCLFIQLANVGQAKTWFVELLIKADGYSYSLYFGVDPSGTYGYDPGLDVAHPPPAFTFDAYFLIDSLPYFLFKDIRAPTGDSILWLLRIVNATGLVDTITWNLYDLPTDWDLNLADTIDMRSSDKAVYPGDQTLEIRCSSSNQGYEYLDGLQPAILSINQGCPNPMHSVTAISYQLMIDSYVSLRIYDISGAFVVALVEQLQSIGSYTVHWYAKDINNKDLDSGIYFYRFTVKAIGSDESFTQTKKLILLR